MVEESSARGKPKRKASFTTATRKKVGLKKNITKRIKKFSKQFQEKEKEPTKYARFIPQKQQKKSKKKTGTLKLKVIKLLKGDVGIPTLVADERAKRDLAELNKLLRYQSLLNSYSKGNDDSLKYLFHRIFVEDIKKDQQTDYDLKVVKRIIGGNQNYLKTDDFFKLFWGKEGILNVIMNITKNGAGAGAGAGDSIQIAKHRSYDTFQNMSIGDSGTITIFPFNEVYVYRVFQPYTAVEGNLVAIRDFLGLPNFVRIVDTTNKGNKFIANYPVDGGRNCITPMTLSCASDACGKTNLESGLKDLIGPKDTAGSEQYKLIQNYAIEDFSSNKENLSFIEFPKYDGQPLRTGLHDFMASRNVVIKCYGYENESRGTLDVKLFYENAKGKLTEVAENANIAGAYRKKFKDVIKDIYNLNDDTINMKEMIFLTKHNGDIAQVLDKYRTFNYKYPKRVPDPPVPPSQSVQGLPRAFETYDVLPACKALLENIDILIFHPFGTGADDAEREAAEEVEDIEGRPVIILKKQDLGESLNDTLARLTAEYNTLRTEVEYLHTDFAKDLAVFNAKRIFFEAQMQAYLDKINAKIATIEAETSKEIINELYKDIITTLSKFAFVAEIFPIKDIVLPALPDALELGGDIPTQIGLLNIAITELSDYKKDNLIVPKCFQKADMIVEKDGNYILKLELINFEREIHIQNILEKAGQSVKKQGALMKFFDTLNIAFTSRDDIRQTSLTSKLTAAAGMGMLEFIKKSLSKFFSKYNFAKIIFNLGNKKGGEVQKNIKNLLAATELLKPTGEPFQVGGPLLVGGGNSLNPVLSQNAEQSANYSSAETQNDPMEGVPINTELFLKCVIPDTDVETEINLNDFIEFSDTLVKEIQRSFELFDKILKIDNNKGETFKVIEDYIDFENRAKNTNSSDISLYPEGSQSGGATTPQLNDIKKYFLDNINMEVNLVSFPQALPPISPNEFNIIKDSVGFYRYNVEGFRRRNDVFDVRHYNCAICPYKNERDLLKSLSSVLEKIRESEIIPEIQLIQSASKKSQNFFDNCVCEFTNRERVKNNQIEALRLAANLSDEEKSEYEVRLKESEMNAQERREKSEKKLLEDLKEVLKKGGINSEEEITKVIEDAKEGKFILSKKRSRGTRKKGKASKVRPTASNGRRTAGTKRKRTQTSGEGNSQTVDNTRNPKKQKPCGGAGCENGSPGENIVNVNNNI